MPNFTCNDQIIWHTTLVASTGGFFGSPRTVKVAT